MEQLNKVSINVFGYYDGSDGIEAAGYFPEAHQNETTKFRMKQQNFISAHVTLNINFAT